MKNLIITFICSLLLFLITCWAGAYSIFSAGWTESICFFVFTLLVLDKFAKPNCYGISIIVTIIAGRIVLELPLRVFEFRETLFSMFVPIVSIVSILLAAVYHKEKRTSVLILAVVILVLLNTVAHDAWHHCMLHDR